MTRSLIILPDDSAKPVLDAIGASTRSVRIKMFAFNHVALLDAVVAAHRRGVDVKVMLSARPSGNRLPDWAGSTYLADIVAAGVRVFLYEKGYLHAKTISIDSEICSIGSTNIDIRSFSINYEINAVLYSRRLAQELEQDFERDLADCTEFDVTEYENRNLAVRFRDSVARVLSPLL